VNDLIITEYLEFQTLVDDVVDMTEMVSEAVSRSGLHSGVVVVFVPGSTGAVTTIEHEPGLIDDIRDALERMAPKEIDYAHNLRWHDGNGHSHVRASILGPGLTVPFSDKRLLLGTWQQIVFLEMDNRPRDRRIAIQIIGE
jgi:secondary thiamine-phosphate synthase enzyme